VRNHDEVAVDALGELDLVSADRLGEAVQDVWAPGSIPIVLELSQVDFIDSTALRMLLSLRNDAKRNQHALTLLPPAPPLRRIFQLTGTHGFFDWQIDRSQP
jgi:anti-sigma B factor antagonist